MVLTGRLAGPLAAVGRSCEAAVMCAVTPPAATAVAAGAGLLRCTDGDTTAAGATELVCDLGVAGALMGEAGAPELCGPPAVTEAGPWDAVGDVSAEGVGVTALEEAVWVPCLLLLIVVAAGAAETGGVCC
jgi:hypothetical protein